MLEADLSRYLWPDAAEKRQPDGLILTRPGLILVNPAAGVANEGIRPYSDTIAAGRSQSPGGVGRRPASSTHYARFIVPKIAGPGPWTIFTHFYNHSALSGSYIYATSALSGTTTKAAIATRHTSASYNVCLYNGDSLFGSTLAASAVGLHTIVITGDGTTATFYVDGVVSTTSCASEIAALDGLVLNGYSSTGGGNGFANTSTILLSGAELRAWNADEALEFTDNPWSIADPQSRSIFIPAASGGSTDLTIADGSHSHSVDQLLLSWNDLLTIYDASHGHSAENTILTTDWLLTVADSTHAHSAESPLLSTNWLLAVQDALHAHVADNIVLETTGATNLAIQDAAHAHLAENLILVTDWLLSIADSSHAHSVENIALSTDWLLTVADSAHAHSSENLTLDTSDATPLTVQDAAHGHSADNLLLTLDTWLAIVNAFHAHSAEAPTLTAEETLQIAETLHAVYSDTLALSLPGPMTLTPDDIIAIASAVLAALKADPSTLTVGRFLALK